MIMRIETVRKRMAAMAARMERDLAILDRMFPVMNLAEQYGDAAETVRNLATAQRYAASFAAKSDEGVRDEIETHCRRL